MSGHLAVAVVGLGIALTAAWIGLLGYGLGSLFISPFW